MICLILVGDMLLWLSWPLQVVVIPLTMLAVAACLARIAMRHRYVMVSLGVFLMMLGCLAYSGRGEFLAPICKTISAFFISRGEYAWPSFNDGKVLQALLYGLFHASVIVYVLSILFAIFGIELVNKLFVLWRLVLGRQINVFWGYSAEANTLAESMDAKQCGSEVFALNSGRALWVRMQDDASVQALARKGWKWVYDAPGLCRAILCAERHFLLGPNGYENAAQAEVLMRRLQERRKHCKLYVRVDAMADVDMIYKWADRWNNAERGNVEIFIVREEELVARRFLLEHPMLECPRIAVDTSSATVSGDFKVLIVGFGCQGKAILNDIICDSQYLSLKGTPVPFSALIFDKDQASHGAYKALCGDAVARFHLSFVNVDAASSDFWENIRTEMKLKPFNRVVVSLPDDADNISIANGIAKVYKEMRTSSEGVIFARVRNPLMGSCVKTALACGRDGWNFLPFGSIDETYSFDNVVTRKWEKGAIWLNGDYNNKLGEVHDVSADESLWRRTSQFNKESTRASFFHQRNLLRLIGYRVDEKSGLNECFSDDDPKNHLEVLAEDEHLRWLAFHIVRGIKVWRPSDKEIENRIANTGKAALHNAIADLNAHADLVEYSELPDVDSKFDMVNARHGYISNKDTQEKDKGFVRSEAMRQSGLGIKKA